MRPWVLLSIVVGSLAVGFSFGFVAAPRCNETSGPVARVLSVAPAAWPMEIRSAECVVRLNGAGWEASAKPGGGE